MLGTCSKAFSQAATTQGHFPKRQLPKQLGCSCLNLEKLNAFILVVYFLKKLRNSFKIAKLKNVHFTSLIGKMPCFIHGEVATWEIVILENVHLGSCHLGN